MDTATVAAEYFEECRNRGLTESTISKYRWQLQVLRASCPLLPMTGLDLAPAVTRPEHGSVSRKVLRTNLGTFFRWCGRRYNWPNPVLELERLPRSRRRLPRVLTEQEVERVLLACRSARDWALVVLMLETGLRVGEVAELRWGNIGLDYVEVRDGKSGDRYVPLSPEVNRLLLGLGDDHYIWVGLKGPLTRGGLKLVYRRLFRAAGLVGPKLGPHVLRHTFATQYIAGGGEIFQLQQILGHASISTTQIYVTLSRAQVAADHAAHSPVATWRLLEKFG